MRLKFAAACLFAVAFVSACNKVDDGTILTDIKAKMFSEPALRSASVNVTSKDGIVTITGTVLDENARSAAERIASQTKGVKQVIDSTTVARIASPVAENVAPAEPEPAPAPAAAHARKKEKSERLPHAPAYAPAPDNSVDASANGAPPAPTAPAAETAPAPPAAPQPVTVTIPEGTIVTVRTIDAIDSSTNSTGQSFGASLDAPVVINDQVVLPKGLNAKLKLVQASSAGKFKGSSELTVSLDSITYQGKTYTFDSTDIQEKGASRGKRSAVVIGGGAALGALIGGLAGGGKGAAIGAAVGGGGGTAVQAMTHGQQVKIPSETRLDFTLHAPVAVTYLPNKKPTHPTSASSIDQQR